MDMERSVRLRLVLAAPVLAALYFYLLVLLIGWTSAQHWPSWWFGVFPSRHFAAITWMVVLHTIGVFSAAVPIAPVYFVTDQIKLLVAVPFAASLIRKLSASNGLPMTAFRQRA
jgi:hypothetical protein